MNLISLLKFITSHPLNEKSKIQAVFRFIKWQVNTRLNHYPVVYQFTEKAKMIVQRGMTGATQNLYCGLHEFNDMSFLLHLLRKDDVFVDIGANIGSFSILSSGHVGAKTISFEPVPETYSYLIRNIFINQIQDKVVMYNMALGSSKGVIDFTASFDTTNHVANEGETNTIKVPLDLLDNILQNERTPILLKIDVEGFETEVIEGASSTLKQCGLKAIIIELNGSGSRYGYDEVNIHSKLLNLNFKPFEYYPFQRKLQAIDTFGTHNTIYIRDVEFVQERLKDAEYVEILNNKF